MEKPTQTALLFSGVEFACLVIIYLLLQVQASLPFALMALTVAITAIGVYIVNIIFLSNLFLQSRHRKPPGVAIRLALGTVLYPILIVLVYNLSR